MLSDVQLCGPASSSGAPLPFAGRQLLLLAVLLVRGEQGVRRDELVEILWPEGPPADPGTTLNPLISRLRRASVGVQGRGLVRLTDPGAIVTDIGQAADAVIRARAALATDPDRAIELGERAATLLAGEFLSAFGDPWTLAQRERLSELRADALTLTAHAGLQLGNGGLARAERAASQLVAEQPLQERAAGLLMNVLIARGEEAAALLVYEELRRRLQIELAGVPGRRLRDAHTSLLRAVDRPGDDRAGPRLADAIVRLRSGELIGREAERARVGAALDAPPGVALAVIHGPAAIGKSRLAAEVAADRHAAGATVLFAQAKDGPAMAFGPFVAALLPLAIDLDTLRSALDDGPGNEAPEADPATRRHQLFDAVAAQIADTGASILLVVDDADRLDRSSAELLGHLARTAAPGTFSVLATSRVWPCPPLEATAQAAGEHAVVEVLLDPMELPGLPGAERARPGTVARVLERLDERTRTVLNTLAVDTAPTAPDVIAYASAITPADVDQSLGLARGFGLVDQSGAMHDAVREAIVERLDDERRAALHARLAVAYERDSAEPDAALPALAAHWAGAGGIAGAARSATYGEQAATRALERLAYEQAAAHAAHARGQHERAHGDDDGRLRLMLLEGDAHNRASALGPARAVLAQALVLAGLCGRHNLVAIAALGHGGHRLGGSLDDPELIDALERGLAVAPSNPALRTRLLARLSASMREDPGGRRTALADEALGLARAIADPEVHAETLLYRHATLVHEGRPAERLVLLQEADALAREAGRIELALHGRMLRFGDLLEAGRPDDARAEATAWRDEAESARVPYHRWAEQVSRPTLDLLDGRLDDARAGLAAAQSLAAGLGADPVVASAHAGMALSIAVLAGETESPIAQLSATLDEHGGAMAWHGALAWFRALSGDRTTARPAVARIARRDLETVVDINRVSGLSFAASAAVLAGTPADDLEALHRALSTHRDIWAVQHYASAVHGPVAVRLALLETALGRFDEARASLDAARASLGADPAASLRADFDHAEVRLVAARDGGPAAGERAEPALRFAEAHALDGHVRMLRLALSDG